MDDEDLSYLSPRRENIPSETCHKALISGLHNRNQDCVVQLYDIVELGDWRPEKLPLAPIFGLFTSGFVLPRRGR